MRKRQIKPGVPEIRTAGGRIAVRAQSEDNKRRNTVRVEEVMTRPVSFCNPGTNAAVAAEIMWNQNCGVLPVAEDGGRAVGIVTDRDLFIALGTTNRRAADIPVGEVMQTELAFCAPEEDVRTALKTMAQRKLRRLPVVDKSGVLKGIVSMNDIVLRAEGEAGGLAGDDVIRTMRAICEHPQREEPGQEPKLAARPAVA
jgi:CBS domain-containing protein